MEAVPRLPMLSFVLKQSHHEEDFFVTLKFHIGQFYEEDPHTYSKEIQAFESLRNSAMHPTKDVKGVAILKRYYCQLNSVVNRFPSISEQPRQLFTFRWGDLHSNNFVETSDIRYEMAAILYNVGALHTQLGAEVNRSDIDGMKLACTHFQRAAWAFGELKEKYHNVNNNNDFMTPELLVFMQQISFAQAQECILEKSLIDSRKPAVIAKVTAQIINYYGAALVALLTGGDDGNIAEVVGSSKYKEWKKYVHFKISYLNCILYLYQGQHYEEQQKMGERVVLYQAAFDKLEEARKESKGLTQFQKEIMESLIFTADVVEAKRKAAKNENEFIYHEAVPQLSDIPAVQGANLVNGISFSVTDPEVAGEDIFARLVPMKAHEASSLYSEEKAELLRKIGAKIEEKDNELNSFMSSLNVDCLNISEERANKIPQGIVDRCASLNAKTNAIPDLISAMSNLAETCADVETNLQEIKELLNEEEKNEKQYQQKSGVHRTNAHFTELSREFQKYMEAHQKAGESNDTLRRAMELHINNLRILSRPLQDLKSSIPKLSGEVNDNVFHELKLLLNKVNEMKAQRAQFYTDLRIAISDDDVTSKVIALGADKAKDIKELFKKELEKHQKLVGLIEQNLIAQGNILKALTDTYAKCAPLLKTLTDVKHKKENFFSSLAASYDVYEDLLAKSAKGLEFYKKLQGNVQKLLTRIRAARDVQDEERQQQMKSSSTTKTSISSTSVNSNILNSNVGGTGGGGAMPSSSSSTPKLKDYLKSGKLSGISSSTNALPDNVAAPYIPSIRPSPLGSETPATSSCTNTSTSGYYMSQPYTQVPNEPPPSYVMSTATTEFPQQQQQPSYSLDVNGYLNPMYQNTQNITATAAVSSAYGGLTAYSSQSYYQNQNPQIYQGFQIPDDQQNYLQTQQNQYQQYSTTGISGVQYPQTVDSNQYYPYSQSAGYSMQKYDSTGGQQQSTYGQQQIQPVASNAASFTQQSPYSQQQQQIPPATSNTATFTQQSPISVTGYSVQSSVSPIPMSYPTQPIDCSAATSYPSIQSSISSTSMSYPQQNPISTAGYATQLPAPPTETSVLQQSFSTLSIQSPTVAPESARPQTVGQVQQPISSSISTAYNQSQQLQSTDLTEGVVSHTKYQTVPASSSALNQQQIPGPTTYPGQLANQNTSGWITGESSAQIQNQSPSLQQHMHGYYNAQVYPNQLGSSDNQASISMRSFTDQTSSYSSHPGYTFNQSTGEYQYGSGYQVDGNIQPVIGQYTNAGPIQMSSTTDSNNQVQNSTETVNQEQHQTALNYYSIPYGHQFSVAQAQPQVHNDNISAPVNAPLPPHPEATSNGSSTYMQSNNSNITQTTLSGNNTDSVMTTQQQQIQPLQPQLEQQRSQPQLPKSNFSATTKKSSTKSSSKKTSSNIDLLSDIDLSSSTSLPAPALQPQPATSTPNSSTTSLNQQLLQPQVITSQQSTTEQLQSLDQIKIFDTETKTHKHHKRDSSISSEPAGFMNKSTLDTIYQSTTATTTMNDQNRKLSCDNLSICSDLSSLDQNFDWDSISMQSGSQQQLHHSPQNKQHSKSTQNSKNPFDDPKIVKYFHKEVERYEKMIESLNVKMLNGNTPLITKWNELHDLLKKDESKRTTSIAKLFPEKNRSIDCIPYDHARVILDRNTDNYINAAFVKDLGPGCPTFILTQTPLQNTLHDFWSMVWSQKARTLVCLHTPNEILDTFWPQEVNQEMNFDDFSVTLVKQFDLSHCKEYHLKLTMNGADAILDLSLIQIKAWTKSCPSQILGIARNVLSAYQQKSQEFRSNSPLVMNCLTTSERCGLISVAICAILATQTRRPILINVIDVWYRICSQRKNILRDTDTLQLSMQIVLCHAHDLLNKRGIMTSYQMKNAQTATVKEKEEIKDPLNELDPLWKLK